MFQIFQLFLQDQNIEQFVSSSSGLQQQHQCVDLLLERPQVQSSSYDHFETLQETYNTTAVHSIEAHSWKF